MSSALQKTFVVFAVIFGMGAHWGLLQSLAWTGMVIKYSQHSSLREALQKTFDGKHPCSICKVVKAGRQDEQKRDTQKLSLKLDPFVQDMLPLVLFPPSLQPLSSRCVQSDCWPRKVPPTPPPILT